MEITVGAFTASLNAQIGERGGDELSSIKQTDRGYVITATNHEGTKTELLINSETADSVIDDTIGDEIAVYSIMENIGYMMLVASRMMSEKQIPNIPHPKLIAFIIQIAEEFDLTYGSEKVGDDTAKSLQNFAEQKLTEQYGQ